ncbi:hypothetical protein AB0K51_19080 [Kitasatospora sp. NPDC049285]|uniref:hypothetical protein n=1 Tax=Kitasatospora sp. NPDC049285 TaxID=3157096 RepID=UPI00341A0C90
MAKKKAGTDGARTGWRKALHQAGECWTAVADVLGLANRIAVKVNAVLRELRRIADDVSKIKEHFTDGFGFGTA